MPKQAEFGHEDDVADFGLDIDEIKRLYEIGRLYRTAKIVGCMVAARWLIFGSGNEPTPAEYSELVWNVGPSFRPLLNFLMDFCPHSSRLSVQILLESKEVWNHPAEVLSRPRPTMLALFETFLGRRNGGDSSAEFLALGDRIERASDFEVRAAIRRKVRIEAIAKADVEVRFSDGGHVARWILDNLEVMPIEEILAGLKREGISTRPVWSILFFLGAKTEGRDTPCRFVENEPKRQAVEFILGRLKGGAVMLSELVPRPGEFSGDLVDKTFIPACGWVLETDPKMPPADLRKRAKCCWAGVRAGSPQP